jgi:hypothetical protein
VVPALPAIVGSAPSADVVLDDASVLPRHARLSAGEGDQLFVDALPDARVEVGGWEVRQVALASGDEVVLGQVTLRVARASPAGGRGPRAQAPAGRTGPSATSPRATPPRGAAASGQARMREPTGPQRRRAGLFSAHLGQLHGTLRALLFVLVAALAAGLVWLVQALIVSL